MKIMAHKIIIWKNYIVQFVSLESFQIFLERYENVSKARTSDWIYQLIFEIIQSKYTSNECLLKTLHVELFYQK